MNNKKLQEEIEFVTQIIIHPAGYDLGLFGGLYIRSTDQNTWEVTCMAEPYDQYKSFNSAKKAAEYFVETRLKLQLGADFEGKDEKTD